MDSFTNVSFHCLKFHKQVLTGTGVYASKWTIDFRPKRDCIEFSFDTNRLYKVWWIILMLLNVVANFDASKRISYLIKNTIGVY